MDARTAESALPAASGDGWLERLRASGRIYDYAAVATSIAANNAKESAA